MAELNFGLLTPPGSQSIGNAFVQGMDQAAVARAQENQNALAQYTLGKAKREDEQQTQLYRDIQDPNFKLDVRTALRYGPQGMAALKAQQDAAVAALDALVKQSTLEANTAELPGKQAKAFQEVLKPYSAAAYNSQTVDEAVANVRAMYANPPLAAVLTKIKPLEQAITDTTAAFANPETRAQWQAHWGGITPEKLFESAQKNQDPSAATIALRNKYPPGSPEYIALDAKVMQFENQNRVPNPVTGLIEDRRGGAPRAFVDPGIAQGVTPQMQMSNVDEARRQTFAMNAAGMPVNIRVGGNALAGAQPQPAAAAPPAVAAAAASPLNPREKFEDFRAVLELEKLGYRRTPEGNFEKISGGPADKTVVTRTPPQEVKFRKDLAADYTTVTATSQGMQDVLDSITDVRNSPGLAGATGIPGALYSLPNSQAAAAQTNLTNLKGKITLLGKTLANQDGKIGPMAVQEWTIVRDMVAALDTAISKGEKITLDEINKIEFAAKNIAKRVQDKFEGQYGDELSNYPQFATVPKPKLRIKPAGGISVTAPNKNVYKFTTQAEADAFKKSAGIP